MWVILVINRRYLRKIGTKNGPRDIQQPEEPLQSAMLNNYI